MECDGDYKDAKSHKGIKNWECIKGGAMHQQDGK